MINTAEMKLDFLDNLGLDHNGMAKAIAQDIERILTQGGKDTARLAVEVSKTPDDEVAWFDLGVAVTADVEMLDYLMAQKYVMENPGTEIVENTPYADISAENRLYEKALKCFSKVLELDPKYYGVQYQMGVVYANMQNYREAEKCFLQALDDDKEDMSAAHGLAMVYHDMGNEEQSSRYRTMAEQLAGVASLDQ